jgi:O-antigen/teichoic acid export membrane protein
LISGGEPEFTPIVPADARAARGTVALVFSQGCYFFFGYLSVVLLARAFGPADYAIYGVILSVLTWMEQAGRFAIPSAATKLLAEHPQLRAPIEKAALILNVALYGGLFVALWVAAPMLAAWFQIPSGTFLFRLAALDLPLFGAYTALQAIHQGNHRFIRLGASGVVYAGAKLLGVWIIIQMSVSLEKALIVNALTTVVGAAFLVSRSVGANGGTDSWLRGRDLIAGITGMMAIYSVFLVMTSAVVLWPLQVMKPDETTMTGLYVAALNIARVPGFGLVAVAAVILPSISRAVGLGDRLMIRRYIYQALRFFVLAYLPVAFVLIYLSEFLMVLAYGAGYSGGGGLLALLVIAEGTQTAVAILGSVLIALGQVRRAAIIMSSTVLLSVPLAIVLIAAYGAMGAAITASVMGPVTMGIMAFFIRRDMGPLLQGNTGLNALAAGSLMFLTAFLRPADWTYSLLVAGVGLLIYSVVLLVFREVTAKDLEPFRVRR